MSEVKESEHIVINRNDSSQTLSLETLNKVLWTYEENKEKYFGEITKHRLGKVLTIIDGAIADETQRKAVKDLVHDAWYSSDNRIDAPRHTYMYQVQKALGIEMREDVLPMNEHQYNPYEELVK